MRREHGVLFHTVAFFIAKLVFYVLLALSWRVNAGASRSILGDNRAFAMERIDAYSYLLAGITSLLVLSSPWWGPPLAQLVSRLERATQKRVEAVPPWITLPVLLAFMLFFAYVAIRYDVMMSWQTTREFLQHRTPWQQVAFYAASLAFTILFLRYGRSLYDGRALASLRNAWSWFRSFLSRGRLRP